MTIINDSLSNYLQGINHDLCAHCFLLSWAEGHGLKDTADYDYWAQAADDLRIQRNAALECLAQLWPEGWQHPPTPEHESYGDQLARLFPDQCGAMEAGGNHCKNITLQVTEACNMACTYCYQINKSPARMSFDTAKAFIDFILGDDPYVNSWHSLGVILDFIGGEPLLEIDLIEQTCDYFLERAFALHHPWATRFMFSICSNGLMYFDDRVQHFLRRFGQRLSLSVTVDGCKELHDACRLDKDGNGTYDRAIAAVKHYTEVLHRPMGSKMTIAPANVAYVCQAVQSMINEGYHEIHLNCVNEEGWTLAHAHTLYEQLCQLAEYVAALPERPYITMFRDGIGQPLLDDDDRNWCGGTGLMLAVDYRGDLYPCLRYMPSSLGDTQPPYTIGTIKDGVCNHQRLECLSCITRRSQSTDECWHCPIASGCSWCSGYNYQVYGTPDHRATFTCDMHKATVLANAYYHQLIGQPVNVSMPDDWKEAIINGYS